MNARELETYLYEHIPVVKRNNFTVESADDTGVVVAGAFEEHVNHRNSVFGGSISTAATLAAWSLVRIIMERIEPGAVIVVQRQSVIFKKPMVKDFAAVSRSPGQASISRFESVYRKFGRARLSVEVDVLHAGDLKTGAGGGAEVLAEYTGEFVVVRGK